MALNDTDTPATGLYAELRRRRVFRTLALYILGAWVLMQVADVVLPGLGLPEESIRYLLIATVAGFPVALVFAWFFDISDGGIRRTPALADGEVQLHPGRVAIGAAGRGAQLVDDVAAEGLDVDPVGHHNDVRAPRCEDRLGRRCRRSLRLFRLHQR